MVVQKEQRKDVRRSNYTLGKPLRQIWGVMQEMSRMLDMAYGAEARSGSPGTIITRQWEPVVTEMPAGEDIVMYFELPGVEREDVELALRGNSIVVSGVKKKLPSLKNITVEDFVSGDLYLGPVEHSPFKRSVELPGPVSEEEVEAAFGVGLLQVRVVGAAENRSRRIHIRGSKKTHG